MEEMEAESSKYLEFGVRPVWFDDFKELPDLILCDVNMDKVDGYLTLSALRSEPSTATIPFILMTGLADHAGMRHGMELGADDYLPKPFNPRELVARVRAILRRMEPRPNAGRLEINGVVIDPGSRETYCDGRRVELTTLEFDILEQLMRAAGRVLSRDALMEALYNRKATPFDRSMDMHISHLRRKLESCGRTLIKTVRGVGYQFCRTAEESGE